MFCTCTLVVSSVLVPCAGLIPFPVYVWIGQNGPSWVRGIIADVRLDFWVVRGEVNGRGAVPRAHFKSHVHVVCQLWTSVHLRPPFRGACISVAHVHGDYFRSRGSGGKIPLSRVRPPCIPLHRLCLRCPPSIQPPRVSHDLRVVRKEAIDARRNHSGRKPQFASRFFIFRAAGFSPRGAQRSRCSSRGSPRARGSPDGTRAKRLQVAVWAAAAARRGGPAQHAAIGDGERAPLLQRQADAISDVHHYRAHSRERQVVQFRLLRVVTRHRRRHRAGDDV
mmetsp:Transcript_344/g.855  ORF Transcript_344/g.855 Transcript_344/m.855 type:complete len:279 (+) Transcript_344:556-1392(+)